MAAVCLLVTSNATSGAEKKNPNQLIHKHLIKKWARGTGLDRE
jgi:hypothetical protein